MHAADPGTVQYVAVGDTILPGDAEDTLEAPLVEGVESALLAHVCCPRFAAIEEGAQHTGLVDSLLVFSVSILFSHTLLVSLAIVHAAFPMRLFISVSSERLIIIIIIIDFYGAYILRNLSSEAQQNRISRRNRKQGRAKVSIRTRDNRTFMVGMQFGIDMS